MAIDADSLAWTWSATLLGRAARDLVMSSDAGEPLPVELDIDGVTWHLLAEEVPSLPTMEVRSTRRLVPAGGGACVWPQV